MKLKKINILFECNSCRDYAYAKLFSKSKLLNKLYIFGKNKNAAEYGIFVNIEKENILNFAKNEDIDMFISFNENHSIIGLIDYFKYKLHIPSIGVSKSWFYLEGLKRRGKQFMEKNNIDTPQYIEVKNESDLEIAISKFGFPFIIKFNGLLGGFGTYIVNTKEAAKEVITNIRKYQIEERLRLNLSHEFDECVHAIAEEYIIGEEYSILSLWDGRKLLSFESIKDYKRALDNNKGQNTGGMGGYMPVSMSNHQKNMINEYEDKLNKIFQKYNPNFTGLDGISHLSVV